MRIDADPPYTIQEHLNKILEVLELQQTDMAVSRSTIEFNAVGFEYNAQLIWQLRQVKALLLIRDNTLRMLR